MDNQKITIADRIRERRMKLGLSQEDVAVLCGYNNNSSITKIEKSGNNVSLKKISRMADALQCSVAYLMGIDESKAKDLEEQLIIKMYNVLDDDEKHVVRMMLQSLSEKHLGGDGDAN